MKVVLVFASFVTVVFGGVGVLTPYEEKDILELWAKYCSDSVGEHMDGNVFYYCKKSSDDTVETVSHNIEVTAAPEVARQVVFVKPPTVNYKHNVAISGQRGQPQKTTIYVLPQKNTHSLDYTDNRPAQGSPEKPSLYFLKGNADKEKGGY